MAYQARRSTCALSRRDFLKLGATSLGCLAFGVHVESAFDIPTENTSYPSRTARVAARHVYAYAQPDPNSQRKYKIRRDTLLHLLEEQISAAGPEHNPLWYRISQWWVHSGNIQRVEDAHTNEPLKHVPKDGMLGEVTVPFAQTYWRIRNGFWVPMYRLYYNSIHWITDVLESPEGDPWYLLADERLRVRYAAAAQDFRPIEPSELAPISPDIPMEEKRIEVSLSGQHLLAFEGKREVFSAKVSTGKRYMETPAREFQVDRKYPSRHMGWGALTPDIDAYELVGVPWVSFFHRSGIAFHGTFWHNDYGKPTSRGCVNLTPEDALWLFRWSQPSYEPPVSYPENRYLLGSGTAVFVS